jgi:hypothetical protein
MKNIEWDNVALIIIKTELSKRHLTYQDLAEKLKAIGIEENVRNMSNKLSRGSFSAIFFIQCLHALGVKQLNLDDCFFND